MRIGKRIELVQEPNGITAQIKTPKYIFLLVFLPIWLIGWTFGGISAIGQIIHGNEAQGFLMIWLCGWFVGEVLVASIWAWNAFGYEVVSIRSGLLSTKREIFGFTITRKQFPVHELSDLRAVGFFGSMLSLESGLAYWGLTGGTVAVDHRTKTHRFGIHLEEQEAKALVGELKPYFSRNI